eukprot:XP_014784150.1 PREDICTED: huntingtin-interacting protein 1-like [Octopus bimaculoides]
MSVSLSICIFQDRLTSHSQLSLSLSVPPPIQGQTFPSLPLSLSPLSVVSETEKEMSSLHLPRVISQRGKTAVEVERENFEKAQSIAINKAINSNVHPVKEKHVRSAILGTFHESGAGVFWATTSKLPLQGNAIICWKFLHVLHKLLREGHANVILDSQKYISLLKDIGKLWGHLKDGYGRLIAAYTKLLIQKLSFHKKNPRIPGSLTMTDEQFNKIFGADVNNYFEVSCDMLDYLDEILVLQEAVFGSLDMSRSNSMTNSGQCRLAPLIPCILDSCQLYDYLVKSLFKLHSSLPPDTLSGHRDRFLAGYRHLKQFYHQSGTLQYFKNLVQVPLLPDVRISILIFCLPFVSVIGLRPCWGSAFNSSSHTN